MRLILILAAILLTACGKPPRQFLAVGQSNLANNVKSEGTVGWFQWELARQGQDSNVDNVAVGGTWLSEWMPGTEYYKRAVAAGKAHTPEAIFFWQGENDTQVEDLANTWGERFTVMITQLRADIGTPDLPVYMVQLGRADCFAYWETVRAQQAAIHLPNLTMLSADIVPMSLTAGCVHFAPEGYHMIADKLAEKVGKNAN